MMMENMTLNPYETRKANENTNDILKNVNFIRKKGILCQEKRNGTI